MAKPINFMTVIPWQKEKMLSALHEFGNACGAAQG